MTLVETPADRCVPWCIMMLCCACELAPTRAEVCHFVQPPNFRPSYMLKPDTYIELALPLHHPYSHTVRLFLFPLHDFKTHLCGEACPAVSAESLMTVYRWDFLLRTKMIRSARRRSFAATCPVALRTFQSTTRELLQPTRGGCHGSNSELD